jgi:hypothetical protein
MRDDPSPRGADLEVSQLNSCFGSSVEVLFTNGQATSSYHTLYTPLSTALYWAPLVHNTDWARLVHNQLCIRFQYVYTEYTSSTHYTPSLSRFVLGTSRLQY